MRSRLIVLVLAVAVLGTGFLPSVADARVFLPSCGNSAYGGREAPRTWDRGCTGNQDLVRMSWRGWGGSDASGRGRTSTGATARVLVYRVRRCRDSRGNLRSFYTRIRINGRTYGLVCSR